MEWDRKKHKHTHTHIPISKINWSASALLKSSVKIYHTIILHLSGLVLFCVCRILFVLFVTKPCTAPTIVWSIPFRIICVWFIFISWFISSANFCLHFVQKFCADVSDFSTNKKHKNQPMNENEIKKPRIFTKKKKEKPLN